MKRRQMIYFGAAGVAIAVAGWLVLGQIGGSKPAKSHTVNVEVVTPIRPDFSAAGLTILNDHAQVRDFSINVDLTQGLNNPKPFGPY